MKRHWAVLVLVLSCSAGGTGGRDEGDGSNEATPDETGAAEDGRCIEGDQQLTDLAIRNCVNGRWTDWRALVCTPEDTQRCPAPAQTSMTCAEASQVLGLCFPPPTTPGLMACLEDGSAWGDCFSLLPGTVDIGGPNGEPPGCTPGSAGTCPTVCRFDGQTTCQDDRKWSPCVCNAG